MDNTIREQIRHKVSTLIGDKVTSFTDTDKLVTTALLNSLAIVELATWLEKKFGIDFSAQRFNIYDFETVESIEALVRSRCDIASKS